MWDIRDSPWGQLHSPTTQSLKSTLLLSLCFRKQIDELTSGLADALGKLDNADKENNQLKKAAEEQDQKLTDMQDQVKLVQYQVSSQLQHLPCLRLNILVLIWKDVAINPCKLIVRVCVRMLHQSPIPITSYKCFQG